MMYLVEYSDNHSAEFNATDFEDLMMMLVVYIAEDEKYFAKIIEGFKNDFDKEKQYIKLYNKMYGYTNEKITTIYEINQYFEGD